MNGCKSGLKSGFRAAVKNQTKILFFLRLCKGWRAVFADFFNLGIILGRLFFLRSGEAARAGGRG